MNLKAHSPIVQIEAEMKDGEDFPDLIFHSSVIMKNNIVLFGGWDSNINLSNTLKIYDLETGVWSQKELKGDSN